VVQNDETMPDIAVPAQAPLCLRVATTGATPPFTYYVGSELRGYDIELARRFAAYLGAALEFKIYDYNGSIAAAQSGDAEAMESLTMGDYETYNQVMERAGREDVLTIVDSYFMPNGSECDRYAILGEIESWEKVKNKITGEDLIMLVVMCNGIRLTVCINELDLQGEPEAGRRFRGIIWLQGYVHFPDLSK
jgi:hypothetical protein